MEDVGGKGRSACMLLVAPCVWATGVGDRSYHPPPSPPLRAHALRFPLNPSTQGRPGRGSFGWEECEEGRTSTGRGRVACVRVTIWGAPPPRELSASCGAVEWCASARGFHPPFQSPLHYAEWYYNLLMLFVFWVQPREKSIQFVKYLHSASILGLSE